MTPPVTFTVRDAAPGDRPALAALLCDTGLFGAEDLAAVTALMDEALAGRRPGHHWRVAEPQSAPPWDAPAEPGIVAAALVAPEPFGDRVANLLFLGTLQAWRRRGAADALVRAVAAAERAANTRLLLVDTGSSEALAPAGALYARAGFTQEATIRGYYGEGEDKVTYVLRLGR
jgi:ribosomal protein S18 acetylase RimI-like enzyme